MTDLYSHIFVVVAAIIFVILLIIIDIGSNCVALTVLEFTLQSRLTSTHRDILLSARIIDMHHHQSYF